MAAKTFDLIGQNGFEQGAPFEWRAWLEAADIDGTTEADWSVTMHVRGDFADREAGRQPWLMADSDIGGGITLSIVPGTTYARLQMSFSVPADATARMPIGRGRYDVRVVRLLDDYPRYALKGAAEVLGR